MARQDIDRQIEMEPKRISYAKEEITKLGYEIIYEDAKKIKFNFKNEPVTLYPYSGWFTGKTVNDNRGIEKLLNQLK